MRNFFSIALLGIILLAAFASVPSYAQAGNLDSSFGHQGKTTTVFGSGIDAMPSDAAIQVDGKIVVVATVGVVQNLATGAFGVMRYLPSGALDSSFGSGGVALTAVGNFINSANAVTIQSDGRIVVAGEMQTANGTTDTFAVVRYNPDGSLDNTFGRGGKVTTEFFASPIVGVRETANAVLIQPDGKILVGGSARQGGRRSVTFTALARYNSNGSLDPLFGSGGKVLANAINSVDTLGIDSLGNIFALNNSAIAQFTSSGALQTKASPGSIFASSLGGINAFQSNGKFIASQEIGVARRDIDNQIVRFNADGTIDTSFNSPVLDFSGEGAPATDVGVLALQPNGQIVAGGAHTIPGVSSVFGLMRLNSNGSLDSTFGQNGMLVTDFNGEDSIAALAIQQDGNIVAVGTTRDPVSGNIAVALARYIGR
ncbi:MAG TPA: hypothetical protein VKZ53_11940 [Candidatus Angelobacter sp.]|nr:hypothetical protein [Candidatus Angelobacter sp.]